MSFSVVILSRNPDNLIPCVRRVLEKEPGLQPDRIIVVDDGAREKAEPELPRVTWVTGIKKFVFARNANFGIAAAGRNDIVLLNDDALLDTMFGFSRLWTDGLQNQQYGVIGSTCNNVGNPKQMRRLSKHRVGLFEDPRMVCFICVLIPRSTIDLIGGLDEEFIDYGLEDDSYCFRVRKAGLKIGICDRVYVDHGSLTSSYRGNPAAPADFGPNLQRYIAKHGEDNWGRKVEKVA